MSASAQSRRLAWAVTSIMTAVHVACLGLIYTGISKVGALVGLLMYCIRGLGVTAGYHRLLAHRAFKAGRLVQFVLAFCGSLAAQGGPLWWVSHHRTHHRHTETAEDPHSPVAHGFWRAHMGWMFQPESYRQTATNIKDLMKFPEIRFLQRHYLLILVAQVGLLFALGVFLNARFPELGTSGLEFILLGFALSTVLLWHGTFMVNSVCHRWGKRPYGQRNESTNNLWVALLTFGEGWHNNHHRFASSARHGLRWWQVDPTYYLLRVLNVFGLVSDLKLPSQTVQQQAQLTQSA